MAIQNCGIHLVAVAIYHLLTLRQQIPARDIDALISSHAWQLRTVMCAYPFADVGGKINSINLLGVSGLD